MNQKAYIHLEVTKTDASGLDRLYTLEMPFGSTYQECYDVTLEFSQKIIEISNQAAEAQKKAEAEKDVASQVIVDAVAEQEKPQGD